MNRRQNGRQLMMIGGGLMVLVLVIGFFLRSSGGSSNKAQAQQIPQTPVVVALQSIPQGTVLSAGQPISNMFAVRQFPKSAVPFGAYTSVNQIDQVLRSAGCQPVQTSTCTGQVTVTQTIYQNLPVVSGMFSTLGQFRTAAGPAFQIPQGYVAVGVNFSTVNSVLGSIQPGDNIDLVASYTGPENGGSHTTGIPSQTQYVINNVRVIGVNGPPPSPSGSGGAASASQNASGGTLLLMVRYQQALVIQHLKDFGGSWTLSAFLRSAKDPSIPDFRTLPVTQRWFFAKLSNHFDTSNPY